MLKRLTDRQRLIFNTFVNILNEKEYPSLELMAKRVNYKVSRTVIYMHIQALVRKGYISKVNDTLRDCYPPRADYKPTREGIQQCFEDAKTNRIKWTKKK